MHCCALFLYSLLFSGVIFCFLEEDGSVGVVEVVGVVGGSVLFFVWVDEKEEGGSVGVASSVGGGVDGRVLVGVSVVDLLLICSISLSRKTVSLLLFFLIILLGMIVE